MRLLYVCNDSGIPVRGTKGASVHVRSITRALAELGHEVSLLAANVDAGPESPDVPVTAIHSQRAADTARALKRWLRDHGANPSLARELRPLLNGPVAVKSALQHARSFAPDAVIERLALCSTVGYELATDLGVPLIIEANAVIAEEAKRFRALRMPEVAAELQDQVLRRADQVIAVSGRLADTLARRGVDDARLHVIPNGVDAESFMNLPSRADARQRLGLDGGFLVGFVGSLKPWHGVRTVVHAMCLLRKTAPSAELLIIGEGREAEALIDLADELHLADAVRFVGAVRHREVPLWLRALDVAVAPYDDIGEFYFSPLKLYEYMAAGTCVVASRLGQIAEVISDGVTGLLCRPGDASHLAETLARAYRDPKLREEVGRKAMVVVQAQHTWSRSAEQTVEVVRRCKDERSWRRPTSAPNGRKLGVA